LTSGKIKYGLIGSTGKLGREVAAVFSEQGHSLVFSYSLEEEKTIDNPELIIDCSLPEVLDKSVKSVKYFNAPLIIATTGLSDNQLQVLKELSEEVPVVQSYNFSIGVQILLRLTQMAVSKLEGWDIEISETHHRFKKDKPSGTALMMKQAIDNKAINISSLRLGGVIGEHTISFGGLGETLSISHQAISRRTFAEGILKSAEFILTKKNGFYSFTDVIFG
jgi:4-hydroxy-tetrahydrodipicolinate reductase